MLYVRLVRVQAISRVMPGTAEKSRPRATVSRTFVTQVPRKLSHSALGFTSVLLGPALMLLPVVCGEEGRGATVRPVLLLRWLLLPSGPALIGEAVMGASFD